MPKRQGDGRPVARSPEHIGDGRFATPFNVIAAFEGEATARFAVDLLVSEGVSRSAIRVHRRAEGPDGDEVAEQRAEMQDELIGRAGRARRCPRG